MGMSLEELAIRSSSGKRSWGLLGFAIGCLTADESNCLLELGFELIAI